MGPKRILSQEQQEEVIRNYKPKDNVTAIGKKYGVHHSSIIRILGDLYVPGKVLMRKRQQPYETQPARETKVIERAEKFAKQMEEMFAAIQVGQQVHYKNKAAEVIQKTDNLVVLKVHKKYRDAICSLNKSDIVKGLIQNIA